MGKNGDGSRNGDQTISGRNGAVAPSNAVDGGSDLGEFLRLVSERRRRYALYRLRERTDEELSVLARRIAADLAGTTPDAVDETHRTEVETVLVHVDIPTLEAADVVSYDRRTETLSLERVPEALETILDACATLDDIDASAGAAVGEAPTDPD